MSLDALPHIDHEPTPTERAAAEALINQELDPSHLTAIQADVAKRYTYTCRLGPAGTATAEAIASSPSPKDYKPNAIDTSRYEAPSAPDTSITDPTERKEAWKATLRRAYVSSAYLARRSENLRMLEEYGKNAWLVHNSQLEDQLRVLEKEVKDVKTRGLEVDEERRVRQEGVKGEIEGLEEGWRAALGRAVEVEIACERLKVDIEKRKSERANAEVG